MPDDFSGLHVFLVLVAHKSVRAAAEQLGVTGSAVSSALRQLEDRLGVALFQRTTRSVTLTEAGEQLHRGIAPAVAEVRASLASLDTLRGIPAGRLRLSVSSIAESYLSSSLLTEFLAAHPLVQLDIEVDDGEPDLVATGFDAGVRLGETIAPDMVSGTGLRSAAAGHRRVTRLSRCAWCAAVATRSLLRMPASAGAPAARRTRTAGS